MDVKVCPICHRHSLGKIGYNRYYCAECCHEVLYLRKAEASRAFYPDAEGELRQVGSLQEAQQYYAATRT